MSTYEIQPGRMEGGEIRQHDQTKGMNMPKKAYIISGPKWHCIVTSMLSLISEPGSKSESEDSKLESDDIITGLCF